ncbi:MAG: NADH:flavin oxidoreductase/NADH oxidase family protein [Myxococcales bacterium]|nr:NADH:flavin oxidoreductase/NADH oxidase family protein [Myxococcales bacterium]
MTHLSEALPLEHGGALPNRIAKSAMSERLGTAEGAPSAELVRLYERWGQGGSGLLITGNVMVDPSALGETGNVSVQDEAHLAALSAWASAAQVKGARVWMQINHPGRQSPRTLSKVPVAPSAIRLEGAGPAFARPRALLDEEVHAIVRRFAMTARIAERAGFDGVQIHGAHGYLISQFLSPRTNQRDDAWGGDAPRRRRFLLEIVRAIRAEVGRGFSLGLKLNSADFQRGGFSEEESMALLEVLDGEAIDLFEISGGTYESAKMFEETLPTHQSSQRREAFFLEYVERARARVRTPLLLTGGFRTLAGMQEALETGAVDVIGMARPIALEPDLPNLLLGGIRDAALPVRLATGSKKIDAVLQGAWYQRQIDRLGRGLEPDPRLSRARVLGGYLLRRRVTAWTPEG